MPSATKPCEVLCLFPVELPTQEGNIYIYITKDVYSGFLFQTGLETSNSIGFALKHIELLLEHKDFISRKNRDFTIVLHRYEQYRAAIEAIIKPQGGTLIIDEVYLSEQIVPVIEHLYKSMAAKL